jgi:phage baseplate assembly protein W
MNPPFTSIRYPIAIDRPLGRLQQEANYAAHVEQLIKQVLFTAPGERINRPDFGCGIKRLVFAPNSDVSASLLQVAVFEALKTWLDPVIAVSDVKVQSLEEVLQIRIAYVLKTRQEKRYLNLEMTI